MVKLEYRLGFGTRALILAIRESLRDGEKPVGDTLHRGDDHHDLRGLRDRPDETGGVEHALRAKQRRAAKLERDDRLATAKRVDRFGTAE